MVKNRLLKGLMLAILFSMPMQSNAGLTEFWQAHSEKITNCLIENAFALGTLYIALKYFMPMMFPQGKKIHAEVPTAKLSDIVGAHPREMVTFWDMQKNSQKYLEKGLKPAQSILFYGPPGNGKTEYARAIANELNALFYELPSANLTSSFMGGTSQNIVQMFKDVREGVKGLKTSKTTENEFLAVLFIDEIDALGCSRESNKGSLAVEYNAAITTLLSELTNYNENKHILIIGATNYKEKLDAALLRPGRFDMCVEMPNPDLCSRVIILGLYVDKFSLSFKPLADGKDFLHEVAIKTDGFNSAELKELCHKVAMVAAQMDREYVSIQLFYDAIKLLKPERNVSGIEMDEKEMASYVNAALMNVAQRKSTQARKQLPASMHTNKGAVRRRVA